MRHGRIIALKDNCSAAHKSSNDSTAPPPWLFTALTLVFCYFFDSLRRSLLSLSSSLVLFCFFLMLSVLFWGFHYTTFWPAFIKICTISRTEGHYNSCTAAVPYRKRYYNHRDSWLILQWLLCRAAILPKDISTTRFSPYYFLLLLSPLSPYYCFLVIMFITHSVGVCFWVCIFSVVLLFFVLIFFVFHLDASSSFLFCGINQLTCSSGKPSQSGSLRLIYSFTKRWDLQTELVFAHLTSIGTCCTFGRSVGRWFPLLDYFGSVSFR